ncbi:MAG: hypothetical protein WCT25_00105 [Candidatus Paceibacterota bacterium]
MTKIILIENDPQQSVAVSSRLGVHFENLGGCEVTRLETEKSFEELLERVPSGPFPYNLVISGMMLPLQDYEEAVKNTPPGTKVDAQAGRDFRRAGVRMWQIFRSHPEWQKVPWIFYTILDLKTVLTMGFDPDSDDSADFVQKSKKIRNLLEVVDFFLQPSSPPIQHMEF